MGIAMGPPRPIATATAPGIRSHATGMATDPPRVMVPVPVPRMEPAKVAPAREPVVAATAMVELAATVVATVVATVASRSEQLMRSGIESMSDLIAMGAT